MIISINTQMQREQTVAEIQTNSDGENKVGPTAMLEIITDYVKLRTYILHSFSVTRL